MTVATKTRPIAAYAEQRAAGDSEFVRRFVATTVGIKRDGLDIDLEGMSTENFMNNPVFLYVHDYFGERLPIGLVKTIRMLKSKMIVTVLFDEDDPFAMEVLRKYDNGFLAAVSIGWDTLDFDRETMRVVESDLLDVSAVPVPGDPDALMMRQRSLLRAVGQELLDKFPEEAPSVGDRIDINQIRELAPTGPDADGLRWRQFESAGVKVTVSGNVTDPIEVMAAVREALAADFGEHGAKCIACGTEIVDEYATVERDGINEVHCVPCADKISGEQEETIDTQEGKRMAVKRVERVVAALDEFRSALSDWIDSAGDEDDDESMAALLAAFDGDDNSKGEED